MANVPITKFAANAPFDANASSGVAKLIGFRLSAFGGGEAVVELDSGPQHYNPMGTVHGGVLCDIADAAMGVAFASTLDAEQSFTTLELKINFLRPVWESMLQAKARVTSRGKTVGLIECDVIDANGRLMARAVIASLSEIPSSVVGKVQASCSFSASWGASSTRPWWSDEGYFWLVCGLPENVVPKLVALVRNETGRGSCPFRTAA